MKFNINETIFKKSLLFFLIGLLFIIFQGNSLNIITSIIGGLLIVMGILNIIKKKDLTSNVVLIVVGAVIIIFGWFLIEFVMLFCGILLVFKSVSELVLYKNINIINSVITLAAGIMMIIAKWTLINVFCIIIGVLLIINSILLFSKEIK